MALGKTVRKPKFRGRKTKWEIKREKRPAKRAAQGKKPLAEPLTIAPVMERQAALKKGKMAFYDGSKRIELDLSRTGRKLVGVYKVGSETVILRTGYAKTLSMEDEIQHTPIIQVYRLEPKHGLERRDRTAFFFMEADLSHLYLPTELEKRGLALKAASKAERHVRADKKGIHSFVAITEAENLRRETAKIGFPGFFEKLGYLKTGKTVLDKFHRIEAIDPKTGKAKIFTFPIKKQK